MNYHAYGRGYGDPLLEPNAVPGGRRNLLHVGTSSQGLEPFLQC